MPLSLLYCFTSLSSRSSRTRILRPATSRPLRSLTAFTACQDRHQQQASGSRNCESEIEAPQEVKGHREGQEAGKTQQGEAEREGSLYLLGGLELNDSPSLGAL